MYYKMWKIGNFIQFTRGETINFGRKLGIWIFFSSGHTVNKKKAPYTLAATNQTEASHAHSF